MKLSLTTAFFLLSLCKASADTTKSQATRLFQGGRPGGRERPGGSGNRLQNMKETKCPDFLATFTCPEDPDSIDCTFDNLGERPSMKDMNEEERAQLKEEKKEKMQTCVCCDIVSVEDILAAKEGSGLSGSGRPGGRPGGSGNRLQNMKETKCPDFLATFTCPEDPDSIDCTFDNLGDRSSMKDMNEEERAQLKEEKKEKMQTCVCCDIVSVEDILAAKEDLSGSGFGGRPGGQSGGSGRPQGQGGMGGRPEGERDIEAMLAEKCPEFRENCSDMEGQDIDCDRFDSMMNGSTRGGRRKGLLYCGCCRD